MSWWFREPGYQQLWCWIHLSIIRKSFQNNCGIFELYYCKTCNIRRTLVGNKIVDNSDVHLHKKKKKRKPYIFILNLTPGFDGLSKDNCKRIQETFKLWDLVWLILEVLWYKFNSYIFWRQTFCPGIDEQDNTVTAKAMTTPWRYHYMETLC